MLQVSSTGLFHNAFSACSIPPWSQQALRSNPAKNVFGAITNRRQIVERLVTWFGSTITKSFLGNGNQQTVLVCLSTALINLIKLCNKVWVLTDSCTNTITVSHLLGDQAIAFVTVIFTCKQEGVWRAFTTARRPTDLVISDAYIFLFEWIHVNVL